MIVFNIKSRNAKICQLYASEKFTTEQIAAEYGLSPKAIARIADDAGILRTHADAQRVASKLRRYHRIPSHLKKKRDALPSQVRFRILSEHPYCALCGTPAVPENPLNVDHIDNDPTNNFPENLQVLCRSCNVGKEHHRRDVVRGRVAA